jgi:hypothetical protein
MELDTETIIAGSLKFLLQNKYGHVLTPDRLRFSLDLLRKVREVEGTGTTFVPQIEYRAVRFLQVPPQYSAADEATTNLYREMGLSDVFIERIQQAVPAQRQRDEQHFQDYIQSPHYRATGKSLEQVRADHMMPFFPFTWIPEVAVPRRREVQLDANTTLYSLAAQMPTPQDTPHESQLYNYIESCMDILGDQILIDSHCTLYFNYLIVCHEGRVPITPKIVLYCAVARPKQREAESGRQ